MVMLLSHILDHELYFRWCFVRCTLLIRLFKIILKIRSCIFSCGLSMWYLADNSVQCWLATVPLYSSFQRRIQDLERGGSSPPLPSPPLPCPSLPSHFPPLPFHSPPPPFPFLSLPRPYPFPPSPFLRSRTPWLRLGGLGERYKLPQRVRAEPGRQTLSGAFSAYLGAFWQAFSSNLSL